MLWLESQSKSSVHSSKGPRARYAMRGHACGKNETEGDWVARLGEKKKCFEREREIQESLRRLREGLWMDPSIVARVRPWRSRSSLSFSAIERALYVKRGHVYMMSQEGENYPIKADL